MKETIVIYSDASFLNGGERKADSYFEYMLSGNEYQIVNPDSLEELEQVLANYNTKLLLFYLGEVEADDYKKRSSLAALSCLRSMTKKPILVVSEAQDEEFAIACLSLGADDYCGRGCSLLELMARIKNQIHCYNRLIQTQKEVVRILKASGGLEVDDTAKQVTVEGRQVKLTPIEYKILYLLLESRGRVLSNKQIYQSIWHMEPIGADNTIAVHIRHLREKIEDNPKQPKWLQVVWGQGYKCVG